MKYNKYKIYIYTYRSRGISWLIEVVESTSIFVVLFNFCDPDPFKQASIERRVEEEEASEENKVRGFKPVTFNIHVRGKHVEEEDDFIR